MPLPRPNPASWRSHGWLLGLPALGLIWGGATLLAAPGIAARIAAEGAAVARATETEGGEPWLRVAVRGRDLLAMGEAPGVPERDAALARLAALSGPRRIVAQVGLVEAVSPFVWSAERVAPDRIALTGSRPAETGRRALQATLASALPPGATLDDGAHAARGAPAAFEAGAAYAMTRLSGLAKGGRATITDTVMTFSGEARDASAYDALRLALAQPPEGFSVGRVEILPPVVPDFHVAVERVAGGGLVLSGHTPSEAARAETVRLATEAADGAFVDDRMHTARGLSKGIDPDALARSLFKFADLMQAGRVAFDGVRLSATGDALDGQAIAEAETLMRGGLPPGIAAGPVSLAARPLSPYRLAIRREAESVSLTGHLPDAASRDRLLAAIRPRFFRERIVDKTRTGAGAPDGLGAALDAAVPALAGLASGEVAVSDRSLSLTGEGLYREAAARLAETLPRALPPDWTARVAVQARDPAGRRDGERCSSGVATALAGRDLRFTPGSIAVTPDFYPALDALAALARACPALRITVVGHGDPPTPKPAAPPEAKTTVADAGATQGIAPAQPESIKEPAKTPAPKTTPPKPDGKGSDKAETKPGKADTKKTEPKKAETAAKPAADEAPAPDLARQRALAIVEYLLQAGAGLDQVTVAGEGPLPAGQKSVAFALRP